jgi:type VI secretion system secreted protein VgrG
MRVRPLCIQWNETDLAFVSRLMEQEGIYYYFEHARDAHQLVLVDNVAAHKPCPIDESIETHLNLERAQIHNDMIYRWEEVATLQPDLVTLDDYDYDKAKTGLTAIEPVPRDHGSPSGDAKLEVYHWPGDHRTIRDGSNYARIRAQEFACRRSRFWLDTNARSMVPGHMFTAANPFDRTDLVRDPTQEKRYLLLGGEFSIVGETGLERKTGEAHFLFSGRMEALPATTQFRPPPRTPRPVIAGVQTAVVVGTPGQDISTNRYGCVRVQFLWDREGRKDERSSCFLRVAQSWAGRGWGGLVTPRVGQEVVVQFTNGDPDWPVITGALYNSSNLPPYDLPAHATRSTFRTRSSPGLAEQYNELRFEDRAGGEEVYLHAQKDLNGEANNNMALKAGNRTSIAARAAVRAEAGPFPGSPLGSSIELDGEGLLTVTSSLNIMLKVGPAGVPLASVLINETGITLIGPTINLVAEDGEINMSGPPIFPPV